VITYGVHSEVGTLRKVLVCSPGLAHTRLTPANCDQLLFDDVMWVQNARRDHFDFVAKMRERGVEVVEMHDLLAETLANPVARAWLLDRQIVANEVGLGLVADTRGFLESLDTRRLADFMIGGLSVVDLPDDYASEYLTMVREACGVTQYLLPPLPNTLYTRDTTCWIYGGVTLNPLYYAARHAETRLATAIYKFHPSFSSASLRVWWGDPDQHFGAATLEGGDVMPVGNGVVLIGMSERTSRQAITQLAAELFAAGAASRVIVAGPSSGAAGARATA
jgi:arginine deiminase